MSTSSEPHLAHGAPGGGGGAIEDLGRLDRSARGGAVGGGRQAERQAGQVLDDAVVQVRRDAPALGVGRVDGADQELLAILLAAAQAPGEVERERQLDQPQGDEPGERGEPNVHQASRASDVTDE